MDFPEWGLVGLSTELGTSSGIGGMLSSGIGGSSNAKVSSDL